MGRTTLKVITNNIKEYIDTKISKIWKRFCKSEVLMVISIEEKNRGRKEESRGSQENWRIEKTGSDKESMKNHLIWYPKYNEL